MFRRVQKNIIQSTLGLLILLVGVCLVFPGAAQAATPTPANCSNPRQCDEAVARATPGTCYSIITQESDAVVINDDGNIKYVDKNDSTKVLSKEEGGVPATKKVRSTVSSGGLISWLCGGSGDNSRNAVEVIIEKISGYILSMSIYIFSVMIILGVIQSGVSGGSPAGIQAGKKRITLAVSSLSLMLLARIILDLTGVTGGKFLGVVDISTGFVTYETIPLILKAFLDFLNYVGGALSVTFIIFGGIRMMTSSGNPQGVKQAGKIITYAVISLVAIGSLNLVGQLITLVITGTTTP